MAVAHTTPWNMEYKVVPFSASIASHQGGSDAASQLESLIASHASEEWEYVRLEQVETHVSGNNGCFGIGATPGHTTAVSMAVFRR